MSVFVSRGSVLLEVKVLGSRSMVFPHLSSFFTYLVSLVIVLRIKLEHFWLLLVVKVPDQVICSKLFSPFLVRSEPVQGLVLKQAL